MPLVDSPDADIASEAVVDERAIDVDSRANDCALDERLSVGVGGGVFRTEVVAVDDDVPTAVVVIVVVAVADVVNDDGVGVTGLACGDTGAVDVVVVKSVVNADEVDPSGCTVATDNAEPDRAAKLCDDVGSMPLDVGDGDFDDNDADDDAGDSHGVSRRTSSLADDDAALTLPPPPPTLMLTMGASNALSNSRRCARNASSASSPSSACVEINCSSSVAILQCDKCA